ncbi:Proteasome subunit beta type-7 [Haplosporangium sp. Z 767]|nr:Proteasome subunit beta type-7 [Haplosporangium sp. Z 767]KAF9192050.1 Proteasome subunit beta type-7 [Haplosporangium sp. Z 11]
MTSRLPQPKGGFNFDNHVRNTMMEGKGLGVPKATKTGTTIVGLIYKDGLVLGADTRATAGPIVADKNCEKIHYLAPNMYCCGAGTAADTEMTTALISSQLELHRLSTGRQARVVTAMTMLKQMLFKYQGHIGAALILGGVDINGPHLYTIYPHGSTDKLPYVTMGSGSLAAMSVFESRFRADLNREEAISLVQDAIEAGIFNDLGSGSNVDVVVITKENVEVLRNYARPNERGVKEASYKFAPGTTQVLKSSIRDFVDIKESVEVITTEAMDISASEVQQRNTESNSNRVCRLTAMTLEKRQPIADSASGSFHQGISQPRTLFRVVTTEPLRAHIALLDGYESAPRIIRLPEIIKPSILRYDTQGSVADHHEEKESHGSCTEGQDSPRAGRDADVDDHADLLTPQPVTVNGETYEYLPICGIPESLKAFIHDQGSTQQMTTANIPGSTASSLEPRVKEVIVIELDDDEVGKPKNILGKRKASDGNESLEPTKYAANKSQRPSTQSTTTAGTQHCPVELD